MNYFFNARNYFFYARAIAPRLLVRVYNIHSSCFIHGARLTSIRAPKDANPS